MTTLPNGRTPAPIDKDGALDFEDKPKPAPVPKPYPSRTFSTQVEKDGYTFTLSYNNMTLDNLDALIDELKDRNYTAVKPFRGGGGGFGQRPDTRVDPAFDEAGNEICPVHKVKIRAYKTQDGREFKGCPSKGTGAQGEKLNQRGYCEFRFK